MKTLILGRGGVYKDGVKIGDAKVEIQFPETFRKAIKNAGRTGRAVKKYKKDAPL